MIACLGMMVARLSAFAGTNLVSGAMTDNCSVALYSGAGVVLSKCDGFRITSDYIIKTTSELTLFEDLLVLYET